MGGVGLDKLPAEVWGHISSEGWCHGSPQVDVLVGMKNTDKAQDTLSQSPQEVRSLSLLVDVWFGDHCSVPTSSCYKWVMTRPGLPSAWVAQPEPEPRFPDTLAPDFSHHMGLQLERGDRLHPGLDLGGTEPALFDFHSLKEAWPLRLIP